MKPPLHAKVVRSALLAAAMAGCGHAHNQAQSTARARRIHERLLTLDTHLDTPIHFGPGWDITTGHDLASDPSQVDYPRMVSGGLDGGFWAIYTPQGPRTPEGEAKARDTALRTAMRIHEMVAREHDHFELALRSGDAAAIAARHNRVVYVSIENSYPLGHDLTLLRTFYSLGARMVGLVHFSNNDLADSSTDPKGKEWNGLSPRGRKVVAEANRLG